METLTRVALIPRTIFGQAASPLLCCLKRHPPLCLWYQQRTYPKLKRGQCGLFLLTAAVPAGPNSNDQTPKQQQQQQVVVLQEGYNPRGIGTVGTFIERHRCQSTVIWHTAGHTAQQDVDEIDLEHDCQQQ
ncbi:hypothetical protein quinque_015851 [Culex quinquefasciatus]